MDIKTLAPTLTVGGQISSARIEALKAHGVRSVICNRPNGEAEDQPTFAEIAAAAEAAGITAHYLPVSGAPTDAQAAEFGDLLRSLSGPVHAFCRSGMRSTILWALSAAKTYATNDILNAARAAGYDLSGHAPRIAAAARTGRIAAE